MTEADWLTATDPESLVVYCRQELGLGGRKERLLAAAVCRRIKGLLTEPGSLRAIDVLELFADGEVGEDELQRAANAVVPDGLVFEFTTAFDDAQRAAVNAVQGACLSGAPGYFSILYALAAVKARGTIGTVAPALTRLLRDIVGNPFRPVAVDPSWPTPTAVALARRMYESRDFSAIPILADALQDAGCENPAVLAHCRDPGPHARGCWVVDRVLGKE